MYTQTRGGTRGGAAEFKWSDVSADKDRENYLGHSINAPTGRWQKNKDVHWYAREAKDTEAERREEIRKIKEAEEDALAVALGFAPANRSAISSASSTAKDPAELEEESAKKAAEKEKRRLKEEKRLKKETKRAQKATEKDRRSERLVNYLSNTYQTNAETSNDAGTHIRSSATITIARTELTQALFETQPSLTPLSRMLSGGPGGATPQGMNIFNLSASIVGMTAFTQAIERQAYCNNKNLSISEAAFSISTFDSMRIL
ncbi:hypothetical protein FRB97_004488 [Tulasnella sp. 331]|nr:hypothetical protein FRB97_004488 [Tulasnella sp. 331]